MKQKFEKNETLFCILLIIAYVLVNSYCMQNYGYTSLISFIINTLLSFVLIWIMIVLKRIEYYGLRKINNIKEYLYLRTNNIQMNDKQ